MPCKKGKGGNKRKKEKASTQEGNKRELEFKSINEEYGVVTKLLGNCNLQVQLCNSSNEKIIAHIRGTLRKKVWITVNDLVLISLRDFQSGKGDVIHVYNADEHRMLKSYGELPESMEVKADIAENDGSSDDGDGLEFDIDAI